MKHGVTEAGFASFFSEGRNIICLTFQREHLSVTIQQNAVSEVDTETVFTALCSGVLRNFFAGGGVQQVEDRGQR
jgi:hypothetical protein